MSPGDFWLQSNNGKNFNLESLQELIKEKGVADNPKLEMFFSLFDTDHDGKISTVNSKGEKELESIFNKFSSIAGDNQVLEESEVSGYLAENNLNKDLSVNDVFDFLGKFIKSNSGTTETQHIVTELEAIQPAMSKAEFKKITNDAYNILLTSTSSSEKLEKDYDDIYALAKEKLSKSGKEPTFEEVVLYAAELQMLNPDVKADKKIKKGTSINIPAKSIDKKKLQLLETKGIKVEKNNYIFFQKLLELDDTKQTVVFNVIKNSKFKTKEEVINEVYNKTKINLADTGLTIKIGGVSSTLENFITKTLKLDLSSKEGLKIYDRLSRLDQKALDSLPKEFIDKLSKLNNITFDKFADKAEVFGIILRTDEEMRDREKNSQEYRDLKARMFMAQYVADNYSSAVTISQNVDRNLNFTQGAWWVRNARPIGYTSNEQQKRDTAKVAQIKKLLLDADTLSNEEFAKRMSNIMEAERTVSVSALPGDLPVSHEAKDPSFKFDANLAYTFMKQMQRAELAAGVAKRLEPQRKQHVERNPYAIPQDNTRVYNAQAELAKIEYTVEPFDKEELKQLTRYIKTIKTKKELFLFAKSLHYKVDVISNKVETMIPKENQAEIAKLLEQKAKELGYAEPTRPNSISLDTFRNVFTKPIDKKVNYPKTNEKTIMETYEATKTKLLGNWDPVGEQIRIQEMEGTVGGVLDIATMILVTKGMGTMGAFVRIGNVGRNIGTATNFFKTASIASRWSKNATLINRLAKADKVLGGLWVNGAAGAFHGSATMGAFGLMQGGVSMADNTVKNLLEGKDWSEGLGERFEQTILMGYENAKFGLFAGYSGVLAQALGKGTVALGSKGIDKLFKTNYSKTVLDKVSSVVTTEGISGSEFFTKMQAASKAEGLVGFGYETGFFTLYHKMEEAGVDFNNEESLLTYIQNNLDEETQQSLGATYLSEGGNLAMFKVIGSLIQWVHIGKLSSGAAMEIQAKNNRALRNMNMRKVVENGKESYLVKFNENDKPIRCDAQQLMQLCEHKMFCADAEDKAQKDGSFKLPNNQTVTYDKETNTYRTTIEDGIEVEASSFKELMQAVQKKTVCQSIEKTFTDDKKAVMLDESTLIVKQEDGTFRMRVIENGYPKGYLGKSVEELLDKSAEINEGVKSEFAKTAEIMPKTKTQEQTKCTENSKEKEAPVKNEDDFEFLEEDDYDPVKTEQEIKQSIINNMQTNYNIKETTINHLNLSELTELQNFIFDLTQKLKTYKNALKNEDFDFERILGRAIFELESFNRAKVPEATKETALQVIMCNPKYKNLVRLFNGTKYQNIEQYKINNNKEHVAFTDSNIYAQELEKSGFDMAVLRDLDKDALGCVYYIVRKLDDAEFLHSKNIEADYLNIEPELNRLSENVLIAAIENLSTVPEYSVFSWEKVLDKSAGVNETGVKDVSASEDSQAYSNPADPKVLVEIKGMRIVDTPLDKKVERAVRKEYLNRYEKIESDEGKDIDKKIFDLLKNIKDNEVIDTEKVKEIRKDIKLLAQTNPEEAANLELVLEGRTTTKKGSEATREEIAAIVQHLRRQFELEKEDITSWLIDMGAENLGEFTNRVKGDMSETDKITNFALENPDKPFAMAIRDVRDNYGGRIEISATYVKNTVPEVQKLINEGRYDEAGALAMQSVAKNVVGFIKSIINDPKHNATIERVSNYKDSVNISVISKSMMEQLQIEAINSGMPIYIDSWQTKQQGSAYNALQINLRTKTGRVIEVQIRLDEVGKYAEVEHYVYDLMTGKDIIGRKEKLAPLFKSLETSLKENMTKDEYETYYLPYTRAQYHYRLLKAFGIDTPEPKLEDFPPPPGKTFDPRLKAENLFQLHELEKKVLEGKLTPEQAVEEYNRIAESSVSVK